MGYSIKKHSLYSYVQIVTIPFTDIEKIDFALCNQPTETPDAYYKRQATKPDIITNGGFFAMNNGNTCFSYKDEGTVIQSDFRHGVSISGNKTLIYTTLKDYETARDFIAAYPALIVDSKKVVITDGKELDYKARRTCIGWNKNNYYIVTVDSPGLVYAALQQIFLELKVEYAINLDGGGSTRLLIDGKRKTSQIYARPVDNVMCVYFKKEQEVVLYRVQVGAFLSKTNAENMLKELEEKGFSGYVKKVGIFYKVQLGAFSVKLNAERLKDKLKSAGYSSFITKK